MAHRTTHPTVTGAAGLLLALGLALAGCSATPPAPGESSAPQSSASSTATAPHGPVDCDAVVGVFGAFVEAALSGISTEVTNGEVAANFRTAADRFDAAAVPADAPGWSKLGQVIHEYADAWAALDPAGSAFDNLEPVEERVDAFAESIGFDNDEYEDHTDTIIGQECVDEFEALFQG